MTRASEAGAFRRLKDTLSMQAKNMMWVYTGYPNRLDPVSVSASQRSPGHRPISHLTCRIHLQSSLLVRWKGIEKWWSEGDEETAEVPSLLPSFPLESTVMGRRESSPMPPSSGGKLNPHLPPPWQMLRPSKAGGYPEVKLY